MQAIAHSEFGSNFGYGKTGCFGRQRAGATDAGIHFNHDHATVLRIDRKLNIGTSGLDPNFTNHGQRGVTHPLIFFIRQSLGRRNRN